jgi:hypothetical protein
MEEQMASMSLEDKAPLLTKEMFEQKFKQIEQNRAEEERNMTEFIRSQRQHWADELDPCIRDVEEAIHEWMKNPLTRDYKINLDAKAVHNRYVVEWACEILSERFKMRIHARHTGYGGMAIDIQPNEQPAASFLGDDIGFLKDAYAGAYAFDKTRG